MSASQGCVLCLCFCVRMWEFIYVVMQVVFYHRIIDEENERSRQVRWRGMLEGEFWMD